MKTKSIAVLSLSLCLGIALFQSCDKSPVKEERGIIFGENSFTKGTYTIVVYHKKHLCVGLGPQECLLIRKEENKDWSLFYDEIEGFEYTEGFTYELFVQVDEVENPPQDGSSLKFKLRELIKKEKVN